MTFEEILDRVLRLDRDDSPETRRDKLERALALLAQRLPSPIKGIGARIRGEAASA